MVSITTGSILYNTIVARSKIKGTYSSLTFHAKFSSVICAVSALTFAICVASSYEDWRYLAFLVFEICVGMYFPVQGMLRGMLISKDYQATVNKNFLRIKNSRMLIVSLSRSYLCSASRLVCSLWSHSWQVFHQLDKPCLVHAPFYLACPRSWPASSLFTVQLTLIVITRQKCHRVKLWVIPILVPDTKLLYVNVDCEYIIFIASYQFSSYLIWF